MATALPSVCLLHPSAKLPLKSLAGKLKFSFIGSEPSSQPFITLLQGRTNEIILREPNQLQYIADAAEESLLLPGCNAEQLEQLRKIIEKKKSTNGTKAQLKPAFSENGVCEKVAVVVKWGGEVSVGPWCKRVRLMELCRAVHARCEVPVSRSWREHAER